MKLEVKVVDKERALDLGFKWHHVDKCFKKMFEASSAELRKFRRESGLKYDPETKSWINEEED